RGLHVLAEKPLTTDLEQTRDLVRQARAHGLALMENLMFVHHGQHAAVRRLLDEGAIGEPRSFTAVFGYPEPDERDIRLRPELGGGALLDAGVYPLSAAALLLGPGLRLAGAVRRAHPRCAVDASGAALLYDRHGVPAQLSWGMDHDYRSA